MSLKDLLKNCVQQIIDVFSDFDQKFFQDSVNSLLNDEKREDGSARETPQLGAKEIVISKDQRYLLRDIQAEEKYLDGEEVKTRKVKPFANFWSEFAEILRDKLKLKLKDLLESYSERVGDEIQAFLRNVIQDPREIQNVSNPFSLTLDSDSVIYVRIVGTGILTIAYNNQILIRTFVSGSYQDDLGETFVVLGKKSSVIGVSFQPQQSPYYLRVWRQDINW